ncbi:uncharacterized protein EI90DRAFT_3133290 [Cantharellus anzutake]|uniref:uncharacterized protein n=1 Tax=Cantharellus anzutake TaxID=1750568 RepID=UPI0019078728|nr:uncharacterized protein EI90DRAFT_3133290 [Cantharellus anzutake]KAF8318298.1 hypothetical protein EI90DRAFT_3133290 [Cantharellus anzutake]
MANLLRSAKSGSDWGENELYVFNIGIANEDAYDNIDEPPDTTKADIDFFAYLEDAIAVPPNEESFVDDFASIVLKLMGYDSGRRIIHQQKELSFGMCGRRVSAKTDVCVMERGGAVRYLLLVQKDKEHDVQPCRFQCLNQPNSTIYPASTQNLSLWPKRFIRITKDENA